MRRSGFMVVCLLAWPAAAADRTAAPLDPEFLEFLAEMAEEEAEFVDYMESRNGERELKRAEEKKASKEDDDE
ncbi:MAG: hypothetical protein WD929_08650 [Steroidobacteraceae bacterium]